MAKPAAGTAVDTGGSLFTSLKHVWAMLEGSGGTTADSMASGAINGTLGGTNTPTWGSDSDGPLLNFNNGKATLGSTAQLATGTDWTIAFGGKQANSDANGILLGDPGNANPFIFLDDAGGGVFFVSDQAVFQSFTVPTLTTKKNYVFTYSSAGNSLSLYVNGVLNNSVTVSNASSGFKITALGLGGTTNPFIGSLNYIYVWDGRCLSGGEVSTLNGDPYGTIFSAAATFSISPTSGTPSTTPTITATGTNTHWNSVAPNFIITSGGTGASISGISVSSDTSATFTLHTGSAIDTLTIEDQSTTATVTFVIHIVVPTITIGGIGDSIMVGFGLSAGQDMLSQAALWLSKARSLKTVNTDNQGVGGTTTAYWVPGASLTAALASFAGDTPAVQYVLLMLGTNDGIGGVTATTFATNMSSICNAIVAAGFKVVVNYIPFSAIGSSSGAVTEAVQLLWQSYQAKIDALVNDTTIFAGDKLDYDYFSIHYAAEMQADGLHPNATGANSLGAMSGWAMDQAMNPVTAGGGLLKPGGMAAGMQRS